MSHIADDVKFRLRRIAYASSREEFDKSIKDFLSWDYFTGKLKVWFIKNGYQKSRYGLFLSQLTNSKKHKQRNRTFESWTQKTGRISRLQKMFFKWNVEILDRKFPSVIVPWLCRTKYPLLRWIQKISKVTTKVLKEPAKKHHRSLINEVDHVVMRSVEPINRTCYLVKSSDRIKEEIICCWFW